MIKYFLLFLLYSTSATAWIKPDVFDSSYIKLEESILRNTINGKFSNANSALEIETVKAILNDKKNLVHDDFTIPKYFQDSVSFWFSIYTQYSSKQVVIHDKSDLGVVYNIIDFSELNNSTINKYAKAQLQAQLALEYTRRLKKILKKFSKSTRNLNSEEKGILEAIKKVHTISKNSKKRKKLFNNLALNIRTQTGQRDMIYRGVIRSIPYFPYLTNTIESFNLPKELLAITFLESSFNPKAYSKVGAAGAWQFMPYIASLFMPKRSSSIDYRLNPIISSISAFHLLKQNKMILKRWDLAVPAYNSGTKHLVKAMRKFKKKKVKTISLEYILENYSHAHLGFASKNFYSEFLALVHVLAYKDVIYPLEGFDKNKSNLKTKNLNLFVAKCSINPSKFIKTLKGSSPRIDELNSHFRHKKKKFKRGSLIISDVNLTAKKYYKLSTKQIKNRYPKNWPKYIYKKKCGRL
jgi:membrane-bound lytic murein transglycosylase D